MGPFDQSEEGRAGTTMKLPLPDSVDAVVDMLAAGRYVADRSLATALFLALKLERPLFLEARPGSARPRSARCCRKRWGGI